MSPTIRKSSLQLRKAIVNSVKKINFMDALKLDTQEKVAKTIKSVSSSPAQLKVIRSNEIIVCSLSPKTQKKTTISIMSPKTLPVGTTVKKPDQPITSINALPKIKIPVPDKILKPNKETDETPRSESVTDPDKAPKPGMEKNDGTSESETASRYNYEFTCRVCGTSFARKEILYAHFIRKHTEGFNFTCDDCGKQFKLKGDMTTHIRLHHMEPATVCEICGKTYKNSLSLYVHQKYAHYKARFECQFCKRCMVSQENLDQHIAVMHIQLSNLKCAECGKIFSKKVSLKRHVMNVHDNIKSYLCPVCKKAFAQTYHMRQHLLLHTGKRLFVCDICGKKFAQKPGLLSHRKVHPGVHPPLPVVRLDHVLKDFLKK